MKIYTSYFYKVRFFPKTLIPLSTAVWPPKYFGIPATQHKDSREVIIGLDIPPLKPGKECEGLCRGPSFCLNTNPNNCTFLQQYLKQLRKLNFNKIMNGFYKLADIIKKNEGYEDVDFALMVYEAPNNKCSERGPLQIWFNENGVKLEEWNN